VELWRLAILGAGWAAWVTPFVLARRNRPSAQQVDRRARWGIVLVAVAFSIVWQGTFWSRSLPLWRVPVAIAFLVLGALLSWTGTRALGRQWRIDAGLNSDHQLITSGPYRVVRHPIYTSMLCILLATGFMIGRFPLLALALIVFLAGTEIRVRIEDGLLASRFGGVFLDYQRRVPAYIPLFR
jgi:protein-S-isoprenylcysteine O-methyltransferase Ste14